MRKFTIWRKRIFYWLKIGKLFWITIAVFPGAFIAVICFLCSEVSFRITGLALQILGIGTVAHGIRETRKMFGLDSYLSKIVDWVKRFPKSGGHDRLTAMNCESGTPSISSPTVDLYLWTNAKDDSTEEHVKALEINLKSVYKRLLKAQEKIKINIEQDLKREQDARTKADGEIKKIIETIQTGEINISAMGVYWLFVGLILSTFSAEFYQFAKLLGIAFKAAFIK